MGRRTLEANSDCDVAISDCEVPPNVRVSLELSEQNDRMTALICSGLIRIRVNEEYEANPQDTAKIGASTSSVGVRTDAITRARALSDSSNTALPNAKRPKM